MARRNTIGEMIVHEAEKVVVAGAHIVFTYCTKSRVLLDPLYTHPHSVDFRIMTRIANN
jgi:hypothetical protein